MQILYERCAGLDVHKVTVVACVLLTADSGKVSRQFWQGSTVIKAKMRRQVLAPTSVFRSEVVQEYGEVLQQMGQGGSVQKLFSQEKEWV